MSAKIFIRERRKIDQGEKKPRYRVVASHGVEVRFYVEHIRKQEVEQIAAAMGAEVVVLKPSKGASDKEF
ncbi:MAG: hypothetical protein AB7E47_13650 [Desulfovibrionaceae bacterium]